MLDAITLSSLLASRLCHDLINPVGALGAGLEIMESEKDPEMQAEALKLIQLSTSKAISLLQFARMAFGAGGAFGEELDMEEVKSLISGIYQHSKAELVWDIPPSYLSKDIAKVLMNLSLVIADCVPRAGSSVRISRDSAGLVLTATGPRAKLKENLVAALNGETEGLDAKMTPAFIANVAARKFGGRIEIEQKGEEEIVAKLLFPTPL